MFAVHQTFHFPLLCDFSVNLWIFVDRLCSDSSQEDMIGMCVHMNAVQNKNRHQPPLSFGDFFPNGPVSVPRHCQTHNLLRNCIHFAYGSGVKSILCRNNTILANRSRVSRVEWALGHNILRSAPSFIQNCFHWCGLTARTNAVLGTMTNPTPTTNSSSRHLCGLVCCFQAGCRGACVTCSVPLINCMSILLCVEAVLSTSIGTDPWNEMPMKRLQSNSQMFFAGLLYQIRIDP